jgi:hypothetical protein
VVSQAKLICCHPTTTKVQASTNHLYFINQQAGRPSASQEHLCASDWAEEREGGATNESSNSFIPAKLHQLTTNDLTASRRSMSFVHVAHSRQVPVHRVCYHYDTEDPKTLKLLVTPSNTLRLCVCTIMSKPVNAVNLLLGVLRTYPKRVPSMRLQTHSKCGFVGLQIRKPEHEHRLILNQHCRA